MHLFLMSMRTWIDDRFLLSIKPIYTQTVGSTIKKYFNIDHAPAMNVVQESGTGVIDSLWFQVIATPGNYYTSTLSFNPVQQTYGALLYCAWQLPWDFALTVNTAFVNRKNNMHIHEANLFPNDLGQVPGLATLTQAFTSTGMSYGKIDGGQSKGGVDDLQIKLIRNFQWCDESLFVDVYGLVGVPTGRGSKAVYLFEPIVGSNHVQCGLGLNAEKSFDIPMCDRFALYGEFKWRYGFKAKETRSFDMTPNGEWSRYLLFTTPSVPALPFAAINELTFKADVTPRSSIDLLLAAHYEVDRWSVELGYNLWYRQAEKVSIKNDTTISQYGIADLVGIAGMPTLVPTSASTANISQGVLPGPNQIVSDPVYTTVLPSNINLASGAAPASFSNGIYASLGYTSLCTRYPVDVGINASYEKGSNRNTLDVVSVWANLDIRF